MKRLLPLLLILSLSGCAALGPINRAFTTDKNPLVQAGVDLAVAAAVGKSGPYQKTRAAAIKSIALQIYAASSAPAATITILEATLNAEVEKVSPNPADKAAFMILTSTLESYLSSYIQANPTGALTSQTLVNIQGLAQAVVTATSFYS